jgi:beta-galactosidase GanA
MEPREGHFDFRTVDGLMGGARARHMRLVLLWFGTWKNSMSCYVPLGWVKENQMRFPRAESSDGWKLEVLSAVSQNSLDADEAAFAGRVEASRCRARMGRW